MLGLALIATGTGGIKPCVAAFGGDQVIIKVLEQVILKNLLGDFTYFLNFTEYLVILYKIDGHFPNKSILNSSVPCNNSRAATVATRIFY